MNNLLKISSAFLLNLPFVLAQEDIPKLTIEVSRETAYAIGALGVALILILIYWILQSRYKG